jgi:hypothetical protein
VNTALVLAKNRFTKTGLLLKAGLSLAEWRAIGEELHMIEGAIQFWIGDWLNYGQKAYGEKYVEAAAATGYDPGSLRNLAYVAANVEMSSRNDTLSWTHHMAVAPLPPERQRVC